MHSVNITLKATMSTYVYNIQPEITFCISILKVDIKDIPTDSGVHWSFSLVFSWNYIGRTSLLLLYEIVTVLPSVNCLHGLSVFRLFIIL